MASKYWLKLFHETIYDPKIMMRSPGARLRWYECLCLAGDYDKDGELPCIENMIYVFRIEEKQLLDELNELIKTGLILFENGVYFIKNWHSRQEAMQPKERTSRFRETERKREYYEPVTNTKRDSNEVVTNRYTDIDKEEIKIKDRDTEEETDTPPLLHPNLSDYEFQNADNINIDDIFLQVTGFLPSKEKDNIRKTIMLIADRENIPINPKNKPKVADILRPYFLEMCRRKNKSGQPYSRNGLFWLLEWAMVGEIPPIYEAKTKTESIADNNAKILQEAIDKYEAENG
jgi:hypothetical protein